MIGPWAYTQDPDEHLCYQPGTIVRINVHDGTIGYALLQGAQIDLRTETVRYSNLYS